MFRNNEEEIAKANQEMLNHPFVQALAALIDNEKKHGAQVAVTGGGEVTVTGTDLQDKITHLRQAFFTQALGNANNSKNMPIKTQRVNDEVKKDPQGNIILPPTNGAAPGGPTFK